MEDIGAVLKRMFCCHFITIHFLCNGSNSNNNETNNNNNDDPDDNDNTPKK